MEECVCSDDPFCDPSKCVIHRFIPVLFDVVSRMPEVEQLNDDGCSRRVFRSKSGKVVYKVPRSKRGLEDNEWEARVWHERERARTQYGQELAPWLARCSLAPSGILVMEHLDISNDAKPAEGRKTRPRFLSYIDDGQGGIARDGRFLLYDYAIGVVLGKEYRGYWAEFPKNGMPTPLAVPE